tara:strand:+ start:245 stop:469 length:225 start_codon:yes stop_codon:yes gene_type:complete
MALEHLVRKQKVLRNELNGLLAGMSNADEWEVSQKLRRITFVINRIKREQDAKEYGVDKERELAADPSYWRNYY